MRNEFEIRKRIDELIIRMKNVEKNTESYLINIDERKKQLDCFDEIAHLYWVLEEPIPKTIFDLIS